MSNQLQDFEAGAIDQNQTKLCAKETHLLEFRFI